MKFTTPTRSVFRQLIIDILIGKRPDAQTGVGSDLAIEADTQNAIAMEQFRSIRRLIAWLWVQTASGDALNDWLYCLGAPDGEGGFGLIKESTTDSVPASLQLSYTGVSPDIQNYELTDAAGTVFKVDESYTAPAGSGTATVALISVTKGTVCNIPASTPLTFTVVPPGIDADAVTVLKLSGAVNNESNADGRARALVRLQQPGLSGNAFQIRDIIEAVNPGVFKAYVYEQRDGKPYGWLTVDVTAVYAGEDRTDSILSTADEEAIMAALEAQLPGDQFDNLRWLDVTESALDVAASFVIDPDASSSKATDFDSLALGTYATGFTTPAGPGGGWMRCNDAIDGDLTVGDTVIVNSARAKVLLIGAASTGGANTDFDVEESLFTAGEENPFPWPVGYNVAAGAPELCSGGGVAEGIYDAAFEYFRSIGPTKESGTAAPLAGWRGSFYKLLIQAGIIASDDGIIDTGYISPVDTEVVDPLTTSVPRIMPGELIFHEDK